MVEYSGVAEHEPHVGDLTGVPVPDGLVEGLCIGEHEFHSGDAAGVPVAYGLVERCLLPKQTGHVGDARRAGGGGIVSGDLIPGTFGVRDAINDAYLTCAGLWAQHCDAVFRQKERRCTERRRQCCL